MPASTRLPGIQFDVVAPSVPEALVRMDIAAFVGFAASGPLHQPVAVEDIAHFEEIFGRDLVIADDAVSNQPLYAYLPSAVRAFFRNGGRRCWVIRVAGPGASSNLFPLPGVFALGPQELTQAHAKARSEGSWSDTGAVGTSLRSQSIAVAGFGGLQDSVSLLLTSADDVVPGDLLKFNSGDSSGVLWFFVDSVTPVTHSSPPPGNKRGRLVTVQGKTTFWQAPASPLSSGASSPCQRLAADESSDPSTRVWSLSDLGFAPATSVITSPLSAGATLFCERLTIDLFVQSETQVWSLTDLGFAPSHPRYWAALPDDKTLYASDSREGLAAEAAHPRFPLAGEDSKAFYLPLCVGPLPEDFKGPDLKHASDPLERDGLAGFDERLFLDPALADSTTTDLLQRADYIRYQSSQPRTPTPIHNAFGICSRKLLGIHAALAIEEATMVAAPDAVQRGWSQVETKPLASPPDSSPLAHPEWWHFLDCNEKANIPATAAPPPGQFEPCDLPIVDPPFIQISSAAAGSYSISWTPLDGAVDFLEEAGDPNFATAAVIYQGSSGSYKVHGYSAGDYFYRMRRQIGSISSNYSNGIGFRVGGPIGWTENPATQYRDDVLVSVHSALLRMCSARGDLFAMLAMPQHYRETQAMAHAATLRSILLSGEQNAYSFGALYYPWLMGREEDDLLNLRTNPPDGAMAGIMAMRSSARGAWISPSNEPLHGVVDLAPPVQRGLRQALQDSLINIVRQESGGFLCLCELTLSDDPDLSPINVRRLLSFLRKTVLRAGNDYVFEPNSDEFRRGVQRGFEILMDELLRRGAFAGRTARESYEVVTDSSLNTRQAMDNGQFFVLLRVAPSLPMRFLTIRLLQTADRTFVTEGG
jgi:hypothetical protein